MVLYMRKSVVLVLAKRRRVLCVPWKWRRYSYIRPFKKRELRLPSDAEEKLCPGRMRNCGYILSTNKSNDSAYETSMALIYHMQIKIELHANAELIEWLCGNQTNELHSWSAGKVLSIDFYGFEFALEIFLRTFETIRAAAAQGIHEHFFCTNIYCFQWHGVADVVRILLLPGKNTHFVCLIKKQKKTQRQQQRAQTHTHTHHASEWNTYTVYTCGAQLF